MSTKLTLNNENKLIGFRYFWGKRVTGFNPQHHCAKCLSGDYIKTVSARMIGNHPHMLGMDGDLIYLCGVSSPYKWDNNLHLALICDSTAESFTHNLYNGQILKISGARPIEFNNIAALNQFPYLSKSFLTCRNFQFGAQYFEKSNISRRQALAFKRTRQQ